MSSEVFHIQEHVVKTQHIREYPGATAESQEDVLYMSVKQYTPLGQSGLQPEAVTIIGAHANGFPKELYEPLWEDIYHRSVAAGFSIRGIWIADITNHGASSVLNEGKLGNDPSWNDHPRDLLHMINHFRDEMPRPLIGIGHSIGGCHLAKLSLIHPRLLATLVLIDPVIQTEFATGGLDVGSSNIVYASTNRRDLWPSREIAADSFKKSKFYQSWDSRVLDRWIKYGLRDCPTALHPELSSDQSVAPPVTLTTTKHQEVWLFLRPIFGGQNARSKNAVNRTTHPDIPLGYADALFYRPEPVEVFHSLPFLRPSVLYVFGGLSNLSQPDRRSQKMDTTGTGVGGSGGAKEGRVKDIVFEDAGHLIPMEFVDRTAIAATDWVGKELRLWRRYEQNWRAGWNSRSQLEKTTVSEEWKQNVGGRLTRGRLEAPPKL